MPSPTQTTSIQAVREVAPDVREITFAPPPEPLDFAPGQWISLHLPVGERPPLIRAYSLAAPPVPTGEIVLCLDRVPEGLGSDYLFSVEPGDEITFAGPLGNFVLPEGDPDLLMLAHYTGIVPFRAMLLHLARNPPTRAVHLIYSAPSEADFAYLSEMRAVAAEQPWFTLETRTGDSSAILGALPDLLPEGQTMTPMVCGKREFVRPIRDFFHARGYEKRAVKWENYD